MSDAVSESGLGALNLAEARNTIMVGRKVGLPNYSNVEFTTFVQFPGDVINDPEQWAQNARRAALEAKTVVCDQLGIAVELDSEGILREKLEQTFASAPAPQPSAPKYQPSAPAPQAGDIDLGEGISIKSGQYGPYYTDGTTKAGVPRKWGEVWLFTPVKAGTKPTMAELKNEAKDLDIAKTVLAEKANK